MIAGGKIKKQKPTKKGKRLPGLRGKAKIKSTSGKN